MSTSGIALILMLALGFGYVYRKKRAAVKAERGGMFKGCLPLMASCRIVQDDVNFPTLTGTYRGHRVRVEAIPDYVGFRKLPPCGFLSP